MDPRTSLHLQSSTDTRKSSAVMPSRPTSPIVLRASLQSTDRPQRPNPAIDLKVFLYTEEEWRSVLEKVRILYMKRQYKQCSTNCGQILQSIKEPHRAHSVYLIYLCFLAASSLELISRSLHMNSSIKLLLLQQALEFYKNTESFVDFTTLSVDPTPVRPTQQSRDYSVSSSSSSTRSSIHSIFSQAPSAGVSGSSSIASSPTSLFCFSTDDNTPACKQTLSTPPSISNPEGSLVQAPQMMKKAGLFSLQQLLKLPSELGHTLINNSTIINAFPIPPSIAEDSAAPTRPSTLSSYIYSTSPLRFCENLSGIHRQLQYHITSINFQIASIQSARKAWRSNPPNVFSSFQQEEVDGVSIQATKKLELRTRIEKLKESGWKRERFDGSRYQLLCKAANKELE